MDKGLRMDQTYHSHPRPEMLAFIPDKFSNVLEIGCGSGSFAKIFIERFGACNYTGVELIPQAADLAKQHIKNVICGDFLEIESKIPDNHYDLIIGNDVFEHFPDHRLLASIIKRKLRRPGYLVASIPNVRHISNLYELLVKKDWEYKDAGLLDSTHLRFFTKNSLSNWLTREGFSLEIINGINKCRIASNRTEMRAQTVMEKILGEDTQYLQFGVQAKIDQ